MNTQTIILAAVVITSIVALAIAPSTLTASASQPRDCFHKGTGDKLDSCDDEKGDNSISCNKGGHQCRD
jgi:hypothetical protein